MQDLELPGMQMDCATASRRWRTLAIVQCMYVSVYEWRILCLRVGLSVCPMKNVLLQCVPGCAWV